MSDAQLTNGATEPERDSTLRARRLLAVVLSFVLGGVSVALLIFFWLKTDLAATFPISTVEVPLWPLATLPMALFFLIWIDYFLGTKIVVD
jgi:hypothetical protein